MSEYKLYCFHHSGNSYKVAQYLSLVSANWKPVFVDFRNHEMKSKEFRESINVQGEVPVLQHKKELISQSGLILKYLVGRFGHFGGRSDAERQEILRWILFDNNKFTNHLATLRYGHFVSPGAYEPAVTSYLKDRVHEALEILAARLSHSRFITNDERPTIADLSVSGYLLYPVDELGLGKEVWDIYPSIPEWLARIRDLPGWKPPYDILPSQ